MIKNKTYRIEGRAPLLMHNGQLCDPLNRHAKALAKISGKKKKTDADHEAMQKTEFLGGLYLNADMRPIIPAEMLEACIRNGARKRAKGKTVETGLTVESDAVLIYDGPTDPDELYAAGFYDRSKARVRANSVMRTRPRFNRWSLEFEVSYDATLIDQSDIDEALATAGRLCALGDWRPRFGRFDVIV